jgi:outer membrane receptor protein involved in Fe transport
MLHNHSIRHRVGLLMAGTAGACLLASALGAPALAQGAPALDEIQVTGSRIQRDGMNTPTPVTMLDSSELQSMAPTTLIDSLSQMPQFLNNSTPATHNVYGAASDLLNLRGIGANRTLVLLDGRRVVSSTRSGAVDIGILPQELVQRVEVVTGGASAAYGSDAVSGVVNFILDTDFTGVKGSVQGGVTDRGDNENGKVSLAMGTNVGESGHLLVAGQYYQADGIKGYDGRNWFQHWGTIRNPDPNGPARLTRKDMGVSVYTYGGLITSGPLKGTQFDDGGNPIPFNYGEMSNGGVQVGGDAPDPNSKYYWLIPDQKRASLFTRYTQDLSDNVTAYVQGIWGYNKSGSGSFPEPFSGPWALQIQQDNAFLPESLRQRMVDEGIDSFTFERSPADLERDRYYTSSNNTISVTTGLDGETSGVRWNAYYQYGQNKQHQDYGSGRVLRIDRLPRALDAVLDDTTGRIVCRSTLTHPDDGCVPLNMFGNGAPSEEASNYVWADSFHDQTVRQHFAEATAQGELFSTWAGEVSLVGGLSYRRDSFRQTAGPEDLVALDTPPADELGYKGLPPVYAGGANIFNRGNPNGGEPVPIVGNFDVWEAFTEAAVPLLRDAPLAQSVDLNLAARYADYSGSGGIWAWKAGVDWQLTDDFRLRGTRSRDVRAGTLSERYDRTGAGGNVDHDPLYPDDATRLVRLVSGGNPNVGPEKADTLTFGGVYQPSWARGLAFSIDYYDIKIKGAIDQLGAQNIVDQCAAGATALCDQITRNPVTDRIDEIRDIFLNVDQARTRGIDFELSYNSAISVFGGGETLALRGFATYIKEDSTTNLGAAKVDRAGETGGGFGKDTVPHWTGTASATYANGPLSLFLQERFISSGKYDATWTEGVEIDDNHVSSVFYTNAEVRYSFEAVGGDQELFFNVSNLFDRDPPLAPSASNYTGTSHTNAALFDLLGRRYTLGLRFEY